MGKDTDALLAERGQRYGAFDEFSKVSQSLKVVMQESLGWNNLSPAMREGLEMIQHKVARMLNGDPLYLDNIEDILGYAQLVKDDIERQINA